MLRYIRERIKSRCDFHVITGSSVGAINGSYIAATVDAPRAQARALARVWSGLHLDQMYRVGWSQVRNLPQLLFGRDPPKGRNNVETIGGLVDSGYIERFVRERIPWQRLHSNLKQKRLHAFSCSATELVTGKNTIFVQTHDGQLPRWPHDSNQAVVSTQITAAHPLASAAIPVLFPAVRVAGRYYVDGSLRQNTPIRPAMRLGANRLLVIGLRHEKAIETARSRAIARAKDVFPNAMFMAGKLLDALMLDKLEADLSRINRMNKILDAGERLYGSDFGAQIGAAIPDRKNQPYEKMEIVLIRPSENLGGVAHDVIRRSNLSRYRGVMARWLRHSMQADDTPENDLASYVLFDSEYVETLMDLGYRDAEAQHAQIAALFG